MQIKNIQDEILNYLKEKDKEVTLIITNGFQMQGKIQGHDNFVIVLQEKGKSKIVYKHAVSTIVPHCDISSLLG